MHKAYKFRLYPSKAQETRLEYTLELCRNVYNRTLAYRKDKYEQEKITISNNESHSLLPEWKRENPELKQVYSQTLQEVQQRVDSAYRNFFRRVKNSEKPGYPRFKGKGWYDSFTYPQNGFKLEGNHLNLSRIGDIRIRLHRNVDGSIKRVTIKRSSGKWYASLLVELEDIKIIPQSPYPVAGIDMGLESFASLSNGIKITNPRFFRKEEKELARVQRRLSRTEKTNPERKKVIKVVQRVHERIANKRHDFVHQLSREFVNVYGFIAFENLNVKGMVKNHSLAKSISDAAWNMLINTTKYKAESAGITMVLVNPCNTSKMCSRCGTLVEKKLSDRVHECSACGLSLDRDQNAAVNILRLGLQSISQRAVKAHVL